jgi:ATP-dependent DNA helicase RecQ
LLHILHMRNIIDYKPATAHPTLRFTVYRHLFTRNELNWHKYNFLIHQSRERLDALLAYTAVPPTACRSRTLETYFGEKTESDCGVCDYCRKQMNGSRKTIAMELRQLLTTESLDFRSLLGKMTSGTPEESEKMIREWMDRGLITVKGGMFLQLKGEG